MAPASHSEHLKLAYFFRASTKGERRAKRSLAGGSVDDEDEELAHRRKSVATELSSLDRVSRLKALRRSVRQAPSEPIVICQWTFAPASVL